MVIRIARGQDDTIKIFYQPTFDDYFAYFDDPYDIPDGMDKRSFVEGKKAIIEKLRDMGGFDQLDEDDYFIDFIKDRHKSEFNRIADEMIAK